MVYNLREKTQVERGKALKVTTTLTNTIVLSYPSASFSLLHPDRRAHVSTSHGAMSCLEVSSCQNMLLAFSVHARLSYKHGTKQHHTFSHLVLPLNAHTFLCWVVVEKPKVCLSFCFCFFFVCLLLLLLLLFFLGR